MMVHGADSGWYRMLHNCFLARRVLIILADIGIALHAAPCKSSLRLASSTSLEHRTDDEAAFARKLEEHIVEVIVAQGHPIIVTTSKVASSHQISMIAAAPIATSRSPDASPLLVVRLDRSSCFAVAPPDAVEKQGLSSRQCAEHAHE